MKRIEALRTIAEIAPDLPIVVTCAATSRELAAVADRDNHLYLLDSMGLTCSVATGLALALEDTRIDRVLVLDGDGSLFMNLNALATMGFHRPPKLVVVILDNASYASTAGLAAYSEKLDLSSIASSCNLSAMRAHDNASLQAALDRCRSAPGPHVVHTRIEAGNAPDIPLLLVDPVVLRERFSRWIARTYLATAPVL